MLFGIETHSQVQNVKRTDRRNHFNESGRQPGGWMRHHCARRVVQLPVLPLQVNDFSPQVSQLACAYKLRNIAPLPPHVAKLEHSSFAILCVKHARRREERLVRCFQQKRCVHKSQKRVKKASIFVVRNHVLHQVWLYHDTKRSFVSNSQLAGIYTAARKRLPNFNLVRFARRIEGRIELLELAQHARQLGPVGRQSHQQLRCLPSFFIEHALCDVFEVSVITTHEKFVQLVQFVTSAKCICKLRVHHSTLTA
mmetsp:Transcript_9764/g.26034  ORF Transcript_9764/g.26034 Transcript_9764/m.26034 type:complete len:253 (+) Transcript_9764:1186-1944(+)